MKLFKYRYIVNSPPSKSCLIVPLQCPLSWGFTRWTSFFVDNDGVGSFAESLHRVTPIDPVHMREAVFVV